jgi:hypothetical protein
MQHPCASVGHPLEQGLQTLPQGTFVIGRVLPQGGGIVKAAETPKERKAPKAPENPNLSNSTSAKRCAIRSSFPIEHRPSKIASQTIWLFSLIGPKIAAKPTRQPDQPRRISLRMIWVA